MRLALYTLPLAAIALTGTTGVAPHAAQPPREIQISVERFSFNPSQIRVPAGTPLRITLRSEDTAHGFHITGTDINVEVPKRGRGTVTVEFVPEAGRHEFECTRVCGAGHDFMRGVIVAAP